MSNAIIEIFIAKAKGYEIKLSELAKASIYKAKNIKALGRLKLFFSHLSIDLTNHQDKLAYFKKEIDVIQLKLLGFKSHEDFLKYLLKLQIEKPGLTETKLKGELWEHFVYSFYPFQKDCIEQAIGYVRNLNKQIKEKSKTIIIDEGTKLTTKPPIINAKGEAVEIDSPFDIIQRATKNRIKIAGKIKKLEFSDLFFLAKSVSKKTGKIFWTICVVVESKAPASAKDFPVQVGEFLARISDKNMEYLEVVLDGGVIEQIKPEQLIFEISEVNQIAVTLFSSSEYVKKISDGKIVIDTKKDIYKNSSFGIMNSMDFEPISNKLSKEERAKEKKRREAIPKNSTAIRIDILVDVGEINNITRVVSAHPDFKMNP